MARPLSTVTEYALAAVAAGGPFVLPWLLVLVGWVPVWSPTFEVLVESTVRSPVVLVATGAEAVPPEPIVHAHDPEVDRPEVGSEPDELVDVHEADDGADTSGGGAAPTPSVAVRPTLVAVANSTVGVGEGPSRQVKKRRRRGSARCKAPHPNIRSKNNGKVELDRTMVDFYTHNLNEFLSLGISAPYKADDARGWKIEGFGCTNPIYKAGFRKGDVLLTVNGKKTRTWPQVLLLYQRLKRTGQFDVEVWRNGAPLTLQFVVNESG